MNARKMLALAAVLAAPLLMAAKCGEAAKDDGPENVTGTIGFKYGPEVPQRTGIQESEKCTYGGFWVTSTEGKWYLCAPSQKVWDEADEGDTYTR